MRIASARIALNYFKQGDDLHGFLTVNESVSPADAFRAHSNSLKYDAENLEQIAAIIDKYPIEKVNIQADSHFICINGPEKLIKELVSCSLADIEDYDNENEWHGGLEEGYDDLDDDNFDDDTAEYYEDDITED